jgi:hypothetical protein
MTKQYKTDEVLTSIHFCTCTITEWLCVFKEGKQFTIIIDSLNFCIENTGNTAAQGIGGWMMTVSSR